MTTPSDSLTPEAVFARLNLESPPKSWLDGWEKSERCRPDPIPFLVDHHVGDACDRIRLPPEQRTAIIRALRFFEDNPLWKRVAWHQHQLLFGAGKLPPDSIEYWPAPDESNEAAALYKAVIFLSGMPNVLADHARRDIPADITIDTLNDLKLRLESYHEKHGYYGLRSHRWMLGHFAGDLYKVGRLQYAKRRFPWKFQAFQNQETKQVVLLAESGLRFRGDGRFADVVGGSAKQGVWTSELTENNRAIRGMRISPYGQAVPDIMTLDKSKWSRILRKGDPVWDMHIPATGPMDFDACGESLRRAAAFLPKSFPEYKSKAFICHSWFLDSQLEPYLGSTSNIVRFMREFYLHPVAKASSRGMMNRVFGGPVEDLDKAPQDTSLRRAVITHLKRGGFWYDGSLVMFPKDLNWGGQVYRRGERL